MASPADTTQGRRPPPPGPAPERPRATAAPKPHAPIGARPRATPAQQNPMHQFAALPIPPTLARLTPTKAEALRTTALAETWTTDLAAELAQRFGPPRPAPGCRIPQAMPATDPIANAVCSFLAEQQRPTPPANQHLPPIGLAPRRWPGGSIRIGLGIRPADAGCIPTGVGRSRRPSDATTSRTSHDGPG